MDQTTWQEVALTALNVAQTVLLAYLASEARGRRGRRKWRQGRAGHPE